MGAHMEIHRFRPEYAQAFRRLNEAWITKHFALEPHDIEVLEDPVGQVIAPGGEIFVAVEAGEPVGCVALVPMPDGGLEVAKMTVTESQRGTGLGRRLLERCIEEGRARRVPRLYLETNSSLAPALGLYRALGFRELACDGASPYARCDVVMELVL